MVTISFLQYTIPILFLYFFILLYTLYKCIYILLYTFLYFFLKYFYSILYLATESLLEKKKAEHWRTDAFELWCWRRLLRALDCKEIKSVNPKGNQSWIFIGRTDAEGEAPILWPPDVKNWLIGKDPDAGKDWSQ